MNRRYELSSLGKYLREFRIRRDELLKDMAETLNVVPAYLSAIEYGKETPYDKLIDSIVNCYDLTNDEISELRNAYSNSLNEDTLSPFEKKNIQYWFSLFENSVFTEEET